MDTDFEPHIRISRAHFILSGLYAAMTLACGAIYYMQPDHEGVPRVFLGMTVISGLLFLLHFFTARGARSANPEARTVSCIIGFLMLFGFPLGTLIGIYLLVYASRQWPEAKASGNQAG